MYKQMNWLNVSHMNGGHMEAMYNTIQCMGSSTVKTSRYKKQVGFGRDVSAWKNTAHRPEIDRSYKDNLTPFSGSASPWDTY